MEDALCWEPSTGDNLCWKSIADERHAMTVAWTVTGVAGLGLMPIKSSPTFQKVGHGL